MQRVGVGWFVALLCLGIGLRLVNLDQKVFWVDEVATVIRAAGYTKAEVVAQLADGQLHTPMDLLSYQQLTPHRTLTDTLQALARSPEHAPLYFLLVRSWMQMGGSSVLTVRSLSVISSVLTLPGVYWFCREWLGLGRVGRVAVLLMAVSPFFVAYAQEARPYSLWLLTVVINSAALLRAVRLQTVRSWAFYTLTLALSLYTSLLSVLLIMGQGGYVALAKPTGNLRRFLAALSLTAIAFLPWVWVVWQHWEALGANTTWMRTALNPLILLAIWLYSFAVLVFDVPVVTQGWVAVVQAGIAAGVLAVMGYSLYRLRNLPRQFGFLAALCLPIPTALILLDLVFQGQASATTRYLMPSQFGVLMAMAAFLAMPPAGLAALQSRSVRQSLLACLIALSLISGWFNLARSPDYQKDRNRANPAIAAAINQSAYQPAQAVVLAEPSQTMDLLSLSHRLNPTVQIQILPIDRLVQQLTAPTAPAPTEPCEYFLFNPSVSLLTTLQQTPNLALQERYQPNLLTPTDLHLSLWTAEAKQRLLPNE